MEHNDWYEFTWRLTSFYFKIFAQFTDNLAVWRKKEWSADFTFSGLRNKYLKDDIYKSCCYKKEVMWTGLALKIGKGS